MPTAIEVLHLPYPRSFAEFVESTNKISTVDIIANSFAFVTKD
jgi:hypothetical protein